MSGDNTQALFPVAFAFTPQKDDKGRDLMGIQVNSPFASYIVALPLDVAEQLSEIFSEGLKKAIQQMRRGANGLTVAPASTLDLLKKGH